MWLYLHNIIIALQFYITQTPELKRGDKNQWLCPVGEVSNDWKF